MDRRIDLAIAVTVVLFGAAVFIVASNIAVPAREIDPLGPRLFPSILGTALMLGGGATAARRLRAWRTDTSWSIAPEGEPDEPDVPASAARAATVMGLSVVYVLTLSAIGYIVGTLLFVVLALWALQVRRWRPVLLTSVGYVALSYAVFTYVVSVKLPQGFVGALLRGAGIGQ
jgi:putative tricarboxylic transport membrane protein